MCSIFSMNKQPGRVVKKRQGIQVSGNAHGALGPTRPTPIPDERAGRRFNVVPLQCS